MSAELLKHSPKVATFESAMPGFAASCDAVRLQIATVSTVREAFALYMQLQKLANELLALTDYAAQRCEDVMERM